MDKHKLYYDEYDDVRKVQSSKHIHVRRYDRRSCGLASFLICGASFSLPRFEPDCFRTLGSSLCREIASQFCQRLELQFVGLNVTFPQICLQ